MTIENDLPPPDHNDAEFAGKCIIVYDQDTLLPKFTVDYPWMAGTMEHYTNMGLTWTIVPTGPISNRYVLVTEEGSSLQVRPELEAVWDKTTVSINEECVATLPVQNAKVYVDGNQVGTVDDGTVEFEAETPGIYQVVILSEPYQPAIYEITVDG